MPGSPASGGLETRSQEGRRQRRWRRGRRIPPPAPELGPHPDRRLVTSYLQATPRPAAAVNCAHAYRVIGIPPPAPRCPRSPPPPPCGGLESLALSYPGHPSRAASARRPRPTPQTGWRQEWLPSWLSLIHISEPTRRTPI